jgi:hypothetical protein
MSHYEHGAVPESLKQSYLDQMLDYYKDTNMQHMLIPEEYTERIQLPFLSGKPRKLDYNEVQEHGVWELPSVPETTVGGTRYVTAPLERPQGMPEHLSYGDVGPDYITMMNIMKAQADPNFNIGFMTDEYMDRRPNTGAYFRSGDQTIAFNPNKMLDWDDPRVQGAFGQRPTGMPEQLSYNREGLRDLSMLEGTTLDFDTDWNKNVAAHELGHYGSLYEDNMPGEGITANKFEFPNWTRNVNMTMFDPSNPGHYAIEDKNIRDVQGHNMAYWVGRGHSWDAPYNPSRDMYLTQEGAQNYGAWKQNAKNYIENYNNPPRQEPFNDRQYGPTMRDVSGPVGGQMITKPDRPPGRPVSGPHVGYNRGGIASLRRY